MELVSDTILDGIVIVYYHFLKHLSRKAFRQKSGKITIIQYYYSNYHICVPS